MYTPLAPWEMEKLTLIRIEYGPIATITQKLISAQKLLQLTLTSQAEKLGQRF
jgi:hypothetical protein